MSDVIVAAPPIPGETIPLLRVAAELVKRGHQVTALLGSSFASAAADAGARFIALSGDADYDIAEAASRPERLAFMPGLDQLNWDQIQLFLNGMPAQHEALQGLLRENPECVLVSNSLFAGAWPVALGAPGLAPRRWIALIANPLVIADDDTTPMGPIPGLSGAELIAANRAANDEFERALQPAREAAQLIAESLGAIRQITPYIRSWFTLPDAAVALTVKEFDFPRSTLPDSIQYGGTLAPRSPVSSATPDWWAELNAGRPVVAVTQGTLANHEFGELVIPTLQALADDDVFVVAALGREVSALGIKAPANARVAAYVPFDELLPRTDVLVTNGGFGGVQQAIAHGVPVVVAGASEDKPMVAAHVAYHGVGIDLGTQTPTAGQVAGAVREVLGEPSYREAAQLLSAAYAGHDPISTIESLIIDN